MEIQTSNLSPSLWDSQTLVRLQMPARWIRGLYLVPYFLGCFGVELFVADELPERLFFLRDLVPQLHQLPKFEIDVEIVGVLHYFRLFRIALFILFQHVLKVCEYCSCELIARRARIVAFCVDFVHVGEVGGARFGEIMDERHLYQFLLVFHPLLGRDEKREKDVPERVLERRGALGREVLYPRARDVAERPYFIEKLEVSVFHAEQYTCSSVATIETSCSLHAGKSEHTLPRLEVRTVLRFLEQRQKLGAPIRRGVLYKAVKLVIHLPPLSNPGLVADDVLKLVHKI